jgi:hypothetical protein
LNNEKWRLNSFKFDEFVEELSKPSDFVRSGRLSINALFYTNKRGKPLSSKKLGYKHGKHIMLEYENGRGKILERIDPVEHFGKKQTRELTELGEIITRTIVEKSLYMEFRI